MMRISEGGRLAAIAGAFGLLAAAATAQFSSGSTGADGALNITSNTVLPVQADGVHNYTTINVDSGATLSFSRNALNTPVILLATGDVTIAGVINLDGAPGVSFGHPNAGQPGSEAQPGPGGFPGGIGAVAAINGGTGIAAPGGGPGGGAAANDASSTGGTGRAGSSGSHFSAGGVGPGNANAAAPIYGDPRLISLSGGSGGAGGNAVFTNVSSYDGSGGGAGGGAILIASSGTITVSGLIVARGGSADGAFGSDGGGSLGAGAGAGGAIRLMANAINGGGIMYATGGNSATTGGNGRIVMEALSFSGGLGANSAPTPLSKAPTVVMLNPAQVPAIQITAIGGQSISQPPTGNPGTPDAVIPAATVNPVTINITTANIPNGSIINLRIVLSNGNIVLANSTPVASNAATASVTLPQVVGVIYATATFP